MERLRPLEPEELRLERVAERVERVVAPGDGRDERLADVTPRRLAHDFREQCDARGARRPCRGGTGSGGKGCGRRKRAKGWFPVLSCRWS